MSTRDAMGRFMPGDRKGNELTYSSWSCMLKRVDQKTSVGRYLGVTVDIEWRSFSNFLQDMGTRPNGHTLDRVDNSKGYYKENCKWSTPKQQSLNSSVVVKITDGNMTRSLRDWCQVLDLPYKTIFARIRYCGWTIDEALCTPCLKSTHHKKLSLNLYKEI